MRRTRGTKIAVGVALAMSLGLAACSSDGDGGDTGSTPTSSGGSVAPAGYDPADAPPFTYAMPGSPGVSFLPLLAAIDTLREQGFEIEIAWLAESELTVEGTATGEFEFSSGTSHSTMLAIEKGAPIKWIADRVFNEWTVYAVDDIADCAGLDGRRLAIHSEGAISTAMLKLWIDEVCPGTDPEEVVISGSPNRYQALIAGQIDASPLELADAIQLETSREGFRRLTSFSEDIPQLKTTTYYGNTDFMDANPEIVHALLTAILEEARKMVEDPAYLAEMILKHIPDFDASLVDIVAEEYSSLGMFPVNGRLDPEDVQFTIDTFADGGITGDGLTVEDLVDNSYLDAVLAELGEA